MSSGSNSDDAIAACLSIVAAVNTLDVRPRANFFFQSTSELKSMQNFAFSIFRVAFTPVAAAVVTAREVVGGCQCEGPIQFLFDD